MRICPICPVFSFLLLFFIKLPHLGVQIKYSRLNSFNLMTVAHNSVTTACVLLLSVGVLSFFTPLFKSL